MPQTSVTTIGNTTAQDNQYIIPESVTEKHPDLVEMIKQTEAMNMEEKNYWFKIIPLMNDEQIANLREILVKERQKLDEINQKYQSDIQTINDKHQSEIEEMKRKKQRQKIKAAEASAEQEEAEAEKALLQELDAL